MDEFALLRNVFGVDERPAEPPPAEDKPGSVTIWNASGEAIGEFMPVVLEARKLTSLGMDVAAPGEESRSVRKVLPLSPADQVRLKNLQQEIAADISLMLRTGQLVVRQAGDAWFFELSFPNRTIFLGRADRADFLSTKECEAALPEMSVHFQGFTLDKFAGQALNQLVVG